VDEQFCSVSVFLSGNVTFALPQWTYLGRISYGLYVFHELIYLLIFKPFRLRLSQLSDALRLSNWRDGLGTALALGFTILLALLYLSLFERPFLRLKKRFTFVPSRD
jgi:peptidoglycan/LPS O-acetylase OafA/YrhL